MYRKCRKIVRQSYKQYNKKHLSTTDGMFCLYLCLCAGFCVFLHVVFFILHLFQAVLYLIVFHLFVDVLLCSWLCVSLWSFCISLTLLYVSLWFCGHFASLCFFQSLHHFVNILLFFVVVPCVVHVTVVIYLSSFCISCCFAAKHPDLHHFWLF